MPLPPRVYSRSQNIIVLKAKRLADFAFTLDYEDSLGNPIDMIEVEFVARAYLSPTSRTWVSVTNDDEELDLVGNKITLRIPHTQMNFAGDGYYELFVTTVGEDHLVLMEGTFAVSETVRA